MLDMEEVDPTIARAIGNWAIDTFGEVYRSKIPLPAMRVLAGGETRRGYYRNPRITFEGDPDHVELTNEFSHGLRTQRAKYSMVKIQQQELSLICLKTYV